MDCSKTFTINTEEGDDCFTNDSALPAATVGVPYSVFLLPAFAADPGFHFIFTVVSGALWDGLSLNLSTGEIDGTPDGNGSGAFCVELTQEPD